MFQHALDCQASQGGRREQGGWLALTLSLPSAARPPACLPQIQKYGNVTVLRRWSTRSDSEALRTRFDSEALSLSARKLASGAAILGSIAGLCIVGAAEAHAQDAPSGQVNSTAPVSGGQTAPPQAAPPDATSPSPSQATPGATTTNMLPPVVVTTVKPRPPIVRKEATGNKPSKKAGASQTAQPAPAQGVGGEGTANATPFQKATTALDQAREDLLPKIGATSYNLSLIHI